MSIWDEMSKDTAIYFVRDAYDESDPTVHIWIGDIANLYGDSACLELGSPLMVDVVPIGNLCETCAENLIGWIREAKDRSAIAAALGIPVETVTSEQIRDWRNEAATVGESSSLYPARMPREQYRWNH